MFLFSKKKARCPQYSKNVKKAAFSPPTATTISSLYKKVFCETLNLTAFVFYKIPIFVLDFVKKLSKIYIKKKLKQQAFLLRNDVEI